MFMFKIVWFCGKAVSEKFVAVYKKQELFMKYLTV